MTKMHLQFLMGIIGFDDDEEEDFGEEVRVCNLDDSSSAAS